MNPCGDKNYTYSVDQSTIPACTGNTCDGKVPNRTFSWHVTGGVILGSSNTPSITVRWNCLNNQGKQNVGSIYCTVKCYDYEQVIISVSPFEYKCVERFLWSFNSLQKNPVVSCPIIMDTPEIVSDCCRGLNVPAGIDFEIESSYSTESNVEFNIDPFDAYIQEDRLSGYNDYLNNRSVYKFKLYYLRPGMNSLPVNVKNACGDVVVYNIPIKYRDIQAINIPTFPSVLCGGSMDSVCYNFDTDECVEFMYTVSRKDSAGNVYSSISGYDQKNSGYQHCVKIASIPRNNSCTELMDINISYKNQCTSQWHESEFLNVKIPSGPPQVVTFNNSQIPSFICPCKSQIEFTLSNFDGCAESIEWEYGISGQTMESITLPVGQAFKPSFCHSWMFGTQNVTGPFSDITVRYRRKNGCGYSAWSQFVIPSSTFKPYTDNLCE